MSGELTSPEQMKGMGSQTAARFGERSRTPAAKAAIEKLKG